MKRFQVTDGRLLECEESTFILRSSPASVYETNLDTRSIITFLEGKL